VNVELAFFAIVVIVAIVAIVVLSLLLGRLIVPGVESGHKRSRFPLFFFSVDQFPTPSSPSRNSKKNQFRSINQSISMPIPCPPTALPEAFRVICLRAVRAFGRGHRVVFDFNKSNLKKCAYCILQNEKCVPVSVPNVI